MNEPLARAGAVALAAVALLLVSPIVALLTVAGSGTGAALDPALGRIVAFTLVQALLSAVLSVGLAVPVARAIARRRFPGRSAVLVLFSVPLVIPAIVAVLGIVTVLGRGGWLNDGLDRMGLQRVSIYGLGGILIAHVFFNLPLAVRLILPGWASIPSRSWQVASQLGMTRWTLFRLLEWPVVRPLVVRALAVVGLICLTSFVIPLALGGGPRTTTMEVAIYQALRFDADLGRVAVIALVQVVICAVLVVAARRLVALPSLATPRQVALAAPLDDTPGARWLDAAAIAAAALFVALPLLAVLARALGGDPGVLLSGAVLRAVAASLAVAAAAAMLALGLGWLILVLARHLRSRLARPALADLAELPLLAILVVPPLALGAGLFVLVRPWADPGALALPVVALVNALMGLPWVVAALAPAMRAAAQHHERLCASLGIAGLDRLVVVDWPVLRRAAGTGLGLVAAYSVGDLGVIALFGSDRAPTLPLLLYQKLGAYRMDEAAVLALLLVCLCAGLLLGLERLVGGHAAAR